MKKELIILFIILILGLVGCTQETTPSLTILETDYTLALGDSITLDPITTHYQGGFTLSFSNESILSTSNLTLTGMNEGTTMVILSLTGDSLQKVHLFVHVINDDILYSISYVLYGGSLDINSPTTFKINTLPITLPTPIKNGYTFGGWYLNATLTGTALFTLSDTMIGPIKLYAQWN